MEESRDRLNFNCKEININPEEFWGEIIQLAFVNDNNEYIAITRLPYENELYIEYNDQINFIYSFYKDVIFKLEKSYLIIDVLKPAKAKNLPDKIIINLESSIENLQKILNQLKAESIPD